jgi:hypothetical protein
LQPRKIQQRYTALAKEVTKKIALAEVITARIAKDSQERNKDELI